MPLLPHTTTNCCHFLSLLVAAAALLMAHGCIMTGNRYWRDAGISKAISTLRHRPSFHMLINALILALASIILPLSTATTCCTPTTDLNCTVVSVKPTLTYTISIRTQVMRCLKKVRLNHIHIVIVYSLYLPLSVCVRRGWFLSWPRRRFVLALTRDGTNYADLSHMCLHTAGWLLQLSACKKQCRHTAKACKQHKCNTGKLKFTGSSRLYMCTERGEWSPLTCFDYQVPPCKE